MLLGVCDGDISNGLSQAYPSTHNPPEAGLGAGV